MQYCRSIISFRGSHPQFFKKLDEFQVSDNPVIISGCTCLELVPKLNSSNNREILYLDRERDFVMVRQIILADNQPKWQIDATYIPDEKVGWVPQSLEYIIHMGKNQIPFRSGRSKVTHYEINP